MACNFIYKYSLKICENSGIFMAHSQLFLETNVVGGGITEKKGRIQYAEWNWIPDHWYLEPLIPYYIIIYPIKLT